MAHVDDGGSGREINVEPNLVPFIDLMSVCIIFLLVTAVWTQVSMIELGANVYGKNTGTTAPPTDLRPVNIDVRITDRGYIINEGRNSYRVDKLEGEYDTDNLYLQLKTIKERNPTTDAVSIGLEDSLTYDHMIVGMDIILNAGFPEVSVSTN